MWNDWCVFFSYMCLFDCLFFFLSIRPLWECTQRVEVVCLHFDKIKTNTTNIHIDSLTVRNPLRFQFIKSIFSWRWTDLGPTMVYLHFVPECALMHGTCIYRSLSFIKLPPVFLLSTASIPNDNRINAWIYERTLFSFMHTWIYILS